MGKGGAVLTVGRPLPWQEAKDKLTYVRQHGVDQFIQHYRRHATKQRIRYCMATRSSTASSSSPRVVPRSRYAVMKYGVCYRTEKRRSTGDPGKWQSHLHPEYRLDGRVDARALLGLYGRFRRVESSMRSSASAIIDGLKENEGADRRSFPLLGASNDDLPRNGPVASSVLVPDEVINPHPRFGALTKNIRERRGSNVEVIAPLFQDDNTTGDAIKADAMAFGMGCCCLQVTFQCRDVDESRHVYDQLAVLAPIMMALTAATPILAGKLQDHDCRWDIASVDDRTTDERRNTCRPRRRETSDSLIRHEEAADLSGSAAASYVCRRCDSTGAAAIMMSRRRINPH